MKIRPLQTLAGYDWILQTAVILLLFISLASHYTSSLDTTGQITGNIFFKQLTAAIIGLVLMVVFSFIDFRWYRSWSKALYLFLLVLLLSVLIFGHTINSTRGWFLIGTFGFQPVEIAKVIFIICLAAYLVYVGSPLDFKKTLGGAFLLIWPLWLVLWQPDFGSASLLVLSWLVLLAMVPKKITWWLAMIGAILLVVVIGWFGLKDYQKARIQVFLNPQLAPLDQGYNVTQSIIAVGAGQIMGRGLGLGTQSQLHFLPEQQTDFMFASMAEELGLIGTTVILFLYFLILLRIVRLLSRLRDDFSLLVAGGLGSLLLIQVALNISMNIGLAPVVGLPLPFLSAGGSSLIVNLIIVGLFQNLFRHYGRLAPFEQNV